MYLKSLEIQGFKSFPDKTVLSFGEDITAIVGPNGSGKSNISDAIRWVMGEQSSRALRGGKMEDVIFGGTQLRKQTGYAEVSLVLDNSEGSFAVEGTEVMVTRRYYRSGESEYYINRRSCRLRDINELFMDTGLGREGYSIIGQGRIDEILSVRSQDRREIFEEAAGISRFRHRKEETQRRLDRTEENLVRIDDKLAELELQVEPLREQAEKAKKFLVLRDELRGLEISLWMEQLDKLRAGNSKLLADFDQAMRQKEEATAARDNLYARSEELSERLRVRDGKTDGLRAQRAETDAKKADADSRAAVLQSKLDTSQSTRLRLESELVDRQERADNIAGQIADCDKRLGEIAEERKTLTAQQTAAQQEAGEHSARLQQLQQETDALRERETKENADTGEAKALLSALAAASQELLDRDTGLRTTLQELEDTLTQVRSEAEDSEKSLTAKREERQTAQNRLAAWQLKAKTRRQRAQRLTEEVNSLKVESGGIQNRVRMLSEMEKMYEGYNKAVRSVMTEVKKGTLKHIRGPVAGLMTVSDAYTVAIEIALGGKMQNIVVDREEDGKNAIFWLKRRDAGRATFLPLSVTRGRELREQGLESQPGFVGLANRLISCDEEYRELFSNLLGRVVIAEDMDSAIAIANRYRHSFNIVTLDGQQLNAGGSMTGGSVSKSAGILSRANELKRLREQDELLKKDLRQKELDLSEANREAEKFSYHIETAQNDLRDAEDAILKLESEGEHYTLRISDLESRRDAAKDELASLGSRSGKNEEDIGAARSNIERLEQTAASTHEEGQRSQEEYEAVRVQAEQVNETLTGLRESLAALEAEEETSLRTREQLCGLQKDLSGDSTSHQQQIEELETEETSLNAELAGVRNEQSELSGQLADMDRLLTEASEERLKLESERGRVDRESREKGDELLVMEREVSVLEQKKTAAAAEENTLLDKLWDNYELSHSAAQQVRFPLESINKATRRISELKRGISALGNVNVGAVEEFDRVNGRYTYLSEQRNDVTKSKKELEAIITGITAEMEVIFREEFKRIQESFSATFLELFGGGRASLELEDPDDVLNCGIEIKVQPPGKSLKLITLLSGGEKAFVAIALYFSILKVRPTPFVVMDEIEAALDDNNVARYAQYMRTLTGRTQFIVITHRRGTMEEADVLYGVTMQEQGVSRMLTINLNDAEKQLNLDLH